MPITAGADERPMVGFVAAVVPAPVRDLDDLDERTVRPRGEPIDDGRAAGEVLDLPGQHAVPGGGVAMYSGLAARRWCTARRGRCAGVSARALQRGQFGEQTASPAPTSPRGRRVRAVGRCRFDGVDVGVQLAITPVVQLVARPGARCRPHSIFDRSSACCHRTGSPCATSCSCSSVAKGIPSAVDWTPPLL